MAGMPFSVSSADQLSSAADGGTSGTGDFIVYPRDSASVPVSKNVNTFLYLGAGVLVAALLISLAKKKG